MNTSSRAKRYMVVHPSVHSRVDIPRFADDFDVRPVPNDACAAGVDGFATATFTFPFATIECSVVIVSCPRSMIALAVKHLDRTRDAIACPATIHAFPVDTIACCGEHHGCSANCERVKSLSDT